jgi:protein involved in polysaccharide export with SLBB domain
MRLLLILGLFVSINCFANEAPDDPIEEGNKIYFNVPGEPEFEEEFEVDSRGFVTLPEIGKVKLSGKTPQRAESEIKMKLSGVYKSLGKFYLEVRSRDLLVTVLGYVNEPSTVTIPQQGNIQMVITEAGGIKPGAQLNKLQIRRDGEITFFDYKSYLDTGEVSLLPKLRSGDTVFIPVSPLLGNVQIDFDAQTLASSGDADGQAEAVTLFGELHSPGSFLYKPGMTIIDALMRAEGVTRYADVTKIRVIENGVPSIFDLKEYLDSADATDLPNISAGTTIFVPIMVEDIKTTARTVYIMGEVKQPGPYEASDKVSFLDLLANAGGPTRFADIRQIKVLEREGNSILFDLQGYSDGSPSVTLPKIVPGDVIFVPEKTDLLEKSWLKVSPKRAVKIIGAVNEPGRYEWSEEMDFTDLFAHSGGPTKSANVNNIKIIRGGELLQRFSLDKYARTDAESYPLPDITAGDTIIVEELPHDPTDNKSQWIRQDSESSIYIMGQVGSPGRYAFDESLHFLDILAAADGPEGSADIRNVRITHRNGNQAKVTHLNLALYFETGDETLFPRVLPGDTIFIPEKDKDWLNQPKDRVVRIMGAIEQPGRYTFDDSMTLLDVLAEAGGPTSNAIIDSIVVINHGCCQEQSRTFDLEKFMKSPHSGNMPVLRAGDTVYIPDQDQGLFNRTKDTLLDVLTILVLAVSL